MKTSAYTQDPAHQVCNHIPARAQRSIPPWRDLRRKPVDMSKTGGRHATPFIYVFTLAESGGTVLLVVTLVTYLVKFFNQSTSAASTSLNNMVGTSYLLTILGGFLADSYLGSFYTSLIGTLIVLLGSGLLTFCVSYSKLRPPHCSPGHGVHCIPASTRDNALFYLALYLLALGYALIKPTISSLGGDQFDETIPKEREEGTRFFVHNYFFILGGDVLALSGGVYLFTHVSPGWSYGAWLILFVVCSLFFCCGAMKIRHRRPTGSFLTRMAQVFVATLRKPNVRTTENGSAELFETDYPVNGMLLKLPHTSKLRILGRAATTGSKSEEKGAVTRPASPWELCTVTQVEETKRILQLTPVWVPIMFVGIIFSQMTTFSLQLSSTLDRNLGPHFTIPPQSLNAISSIMGLIFIPIYAYIIVPIARRFNNNPYGFTPLQRMGSCLFFAICSLISLALVERKRVSVVRDLHMEDLILGTFVLPMTIWWMLPVYFFFALVQFNIYVSSLEFFYKESSLETHSIGAAFTWSAFALSCYISSILIHLVNRYTRHEKGGSWLKGQLNTGGIEKYFWLLSVIMAVVFLAFLAVSNWYTYTYDWYHKHDPQFEKHLADSSISVELSRNKKTQEH